MIKATISPTLVFGAAVAGALTGCVSTPKLDAVPIGDHHATFICYRGDVQVSLLDRDYELVAAETLAGGDNFKHEFDEFVENKINKIDFERLLGTQEQLTYNNGKIPEYSTICPGW